MTGPAITPPDAPPGACGTLGLDVDGVKAVNMLLEDITGTHTGAKVRNAELSGDFTAKGVHGGGSGSGN